VVIIRIAAGAALLLVAIAILLFVLRRRERLALPPNGRLIRNRTELLCAVSGVLIAGVGLSLVYGTWRHLISAAILAAFPLIVAAVRSLVGALRFRSKRRG
jgi:hypothetical protein